jgi:tripartite-type tricarboxylate transporter receptor subunit TctC
MRTFARIVTRCLVAASTLSFAAYAHAQAWPAGPIRIVAPVPPGGGVDTLARAVGVQLQSAFGVPVVVENKPGASAVIGTDFVARSAPDGNTLLMGYSVLATNKFLVQTLPYDLERDLAPVAYIGYIPLMLVAAPSLPANSLAELIALAKANPGKYQYASGGAGSSSHLSGEMFKHMTGVDLVHVPYKGDAPALGDVLGGHVPLMFVTVTTALPHVKSGKLKALATTGDRRAALASEYPTMIEAGVPGFETKAWYMVFAPRKTPREVLEKLNGAINTAINDPAVQRLTAQGVVFVGGTVSQADSFLAGEINRWGNVIAAARIKAD